MRDEYDFTEARRGPVLPMAGGKTRITIRLDDAVVEWFRKQVHQSGGGSYQTLINDALREFIRQSGEPLEVLVRRVVREEMVRPTYAKPQGRKKR